MLPDSSKTLSDKVGAVHNGFGGNIHKFKLAIPQQVTSYQAFKKTITENEAKLIEAIQKLLYMQNNGEQFEVRNNIIVA